jgi:hypothetical protein
VNSDLRQVRGFGVERLTAQRSLPAIGSVVCPLCPSQDPVGPSEFRHPEYRIVVRKGD